MYIIISVSTAIWLTYIGLHLIGVAILLWRASYLGMDMYASWPQLLIIAICWPIFFLILEIGGDALQQYLIRMASEEEEEDVWVMDLHCNECGKRTEHIIIKKWPKEYGICENCGTTQVIPPDEAPTDDTSV